MISNPLLDRRIDMLIAVGPTEDYPDEPRTAYPVFSHNEPLGPTLREAFIAMLRDDNPAQEPLSGDQDRLARLEERFEELQEAILAPPKRGRQRVVVGKPPKAIRDTIRKRGRQAR